MTSEALLNNAVWEGKIFLGGWQNSTAGAIVVREPATGESLGVVGAASTADVTVAIQRAAAAQPDWAATPARRKAEILLKAADLLDTARGELVPVIVRETGGLIPKAELELSETVAILRHSAAMLAEAQGVILPSAPGRTSLARREPHGVVGVIAPFNFPLVLSARAVCPALATGNSVVLKPDPRTPITGGVILAQIFEAAGLPADVFHMLPGGAEIGSAIVESPSTRLIWFTGSTAAGRKIGEVCGRLLKRTSLELGGKSPLIILQDANLDQAVSNAAFGAFLHQGQVCMASGRILVQQQIAAEFTARLAERANVLPVGNPLNGNVALGPLIDAGQRDRVHAIVTDSVAQGAQLLAGGTYEDLFYRPTVLAGVRPGVRAYHEEVFGPVANVITFDSDDEAVRIANDTDYGLSAGIISPDLARAQAIGDKVRSGLLHINEQTIADEVANPFGGRGASGNGGNIGGPANWDVFTQWRWTTMVASPSPKPF